MKKLLLITLLLIAGRSAYAQSGKLTILNHSPCDVDMIVLAKDGTYIKIRAGASLLQLYTALVYEGPGLVERIKQGLAARLKADGFRSLDEAVGADCR